MFRGFSRYEINVIADLNHLESNLRQAAKATIRIDATAAGYLRNAANIAGWHADKLGQIQKYWPEGLVKLEGGTYGPVITSVDTAEVEDNKIVGALIPNLDLLIETLEFMPEQLQQGEMSKEDFQELAEPFRLACKFVIPDLIDSAINCIRFRLGFKPNRSMRGWSDRVNHPFIFYCPTCGTVWFSDLKGEKCDICETPSNLFEFYPGGNWARYWNTMVDSMAKENA